MPSTSTRTGFARTRRPIGHPACTFHTREVHITAPAGSGLGERRVVTALFCDIVGSTSMAETLDPEDWTEIVNEMVGHMAAAVEKYGGTIAHFGGDSILGLFGAPTAREDDPYRAVRAGLTILETIAAASDLDLEVRVGINTGLVVVGDVTTGDLSTYTALGDATNVASRIQSEADPGTMLISQDTYELVTGDVEVEALEPVTVKGKAEPIQVYQVVSVLGTNLRRRGVPGLHSPMVGRDDELGALVSAMDIAAAGSGRVAVIVGEPGVGKSRLIAELESAVDEAPGGRFALGRCASFDEVRPYHLIASLLCSMAGVSLEDDPDVITKGITALCDAASDEANANDLLQMIGVADGSQGDTDTKVDSYEASLLAVIRCLAADHAPLVLVCEDAHWADASSTELLARLIPAMSQMPVLGVLVTRPDRDAHGWSVVEEARRELGEMLIEVAITPLDADSSRLLVANLLEIESLPDDLRAMILDKAEGNPFFLEEVVRMLLDRDLIEEIDGRWVAKAEIANLDVPGSLQSLLASRIDTLAASTRSVAMQAAVVGRQFDVPLLAEVVGDREPTMAALVDLESHGVIKLVETRPRLAYRFRHALIHDVVYESILRRERRRLHKDVGDAIEHVHADRLDELAPVLFRHYAEAGENEKALDYTVRAAEEATARHASREAMDFYRLALGLVEEGDDETAVRTRLRLAIGVARSGIRFTPGDESLTQLEKMRTAAEELGDPDLMGQVYSLILVVRTMGAEWYGDEAFRDVMDRAFALAPEISDPGLSASLTGLMGQILRGQDEYLRAAELMGSAVDPLEEAGLITDAAMNAILTGDVLGQHGDFAEAHEWLDRGEELARRSGNPTAIADTNLIRGRTLATQGELDEALTHTRRGMNLAQDADNLFCELVGNFLVADQQLRLGQAQEAIPHLEKSFELGEYCNAAGFMMLGRAWIASANARLGDIDPDAYTESLDQAIAGRTRSGEAGIRLHRAIAISSLPEPDWDAAFADFERSIELFREIEARPDLARALHAYAMALDAAGRPEGVAVLEEASAIFDDLGMTRDPIPA